MYHIWGDIQLGSSGVGQADVDHTLILARLFSFDEAISFQPVDDARYGRPAIVLRESIQRTEPRVAERFAVAKFRSVAEGQRLKKGQFT